MAMRTEDILARLDFWWRASRASFLTASIMPVLLGGAMAFNHSGRIDWLTFLLTLIGTICVHIGANLLNDYGDHLLGSDALNREYTPFSGGSRLIQAGLVQPATIFKVSMAFLLLTVLIGITLVLIIQDWRLFIFGVVGVFIALAYSLPPFKLAFRGWGELVVSLAFGPLIVVGTSFVQLRKFDWASWWVSIPAGLLVGLILYINEVQDEKADRASEKLTLVVRLANMQTVLKIYRWVLLICYLLIPILVLTAQLPILSLLYLLSLVMVHKIWHLSREKFRHPSEILALNALTIQFQIVFIGLLVVALILDKLLF